MSTICIHYLPSFLYFLYFIFFIFFIFSSLPFFIFPLIFTSPSSPPFSCLNNHPPSPIVGLKMSPRSPLPPQFLIINLKRYKPLAPHANFTPKLSKIPFRQVNEIDHRRNSENLEGVAVPDVIDICNIANLER